MPKFRSSPSNPTKKNQSATEAARGKHITQKKNTSSSSRKIIGEKRKQKVEKETQIKEAYANQPQVPSSLKDNDEETAAEQQQQQQQ